MAVLSLAKLVRCYPAVVGVPECLGHPHVLRGYYATTLSGDVEATAGRGRPAMPLAAPRLSRVANGRDALSRVLAAPPS